MMNRRDLLQSTAWLCALPTLSVITPLRAAPSTRFDHAALKGQARALAQQPYREPQDLAPQWLQDLSYDDYQAIRFRREHALWADRDSYFRLEFFHPGRGFKEPVRMHEVVDGVAHEIGYSPTAYDFERSGIDTKRLPSRLTFAGFRIHTALHWQADAAAFLGASYFRGVGSDTRQFGLSARGAAIDTALEKEEFPRFVAWYFERPRADARTLIIHGLLDSPSMTGAYRFAITPGAPQVMEVDAALYPRTAIRRLGIAPLTSMFQMGENDRRMANDWRPEIHDSDGLALHTGNGEWLWRPLTNPAQLRFNSYADTSPRGFGLLQRDRNFEHYQDDGVFYERRPSLWIEPKGDWGAGSVQLTEIPTEDETFDNIVAFWNPEAAVQPGQELLFSYRMHWGTQMPVVPPLAQVVATRTGIGGVVGQPRRYFSQRFAVDFTGGELAALPEDTEMEAVVTASRGSVELVSARPLKSINGYRAMFDLRPPQGDDSPIDLRLFLRFGSVALSETWTYQWARS